MPELSRATPVSTASAVHHAWWGVALKVALAAGAIALLAAAWFEWIAPHEGDLERRLRELGAWAPVIYVALVAVATSLFLPKSLFSMAAGAIFGPFWGLLWVLAGCGLSASLVFLLANRGLRDAVSRRLADHPKLAAIDAAVAARGPRLVLLLRATPVSFAGMNWVLSASGLSWRSYSIGLIGLVPGTLSAVAIGYAARHTADLASRTAAEGSLAPGDSILREIGLYASVAASVLVTVVVTRIAVRAVHEATGAA